MPNQTMAAWIVRCGERGQKGALERFEANSVAALGWGTGDLSQINSQDELRDRLQGLYPEASNQRLGSWASSIFSFVKKIAVGDLILTPSTTSEEVLIGRCQGDYEYWPEWDNDDSGNYECVRKVDWLKKVTRSGLPESLRSELNSPRSRATVTEIKEQQQIEDIRVLLEETGKKFPQSLQAMITCGTLSYIGPSCFTNGSYSTSMSGTTSCKSGRDWLLSSKLSGTATLIGKTC